MGNTLSKPPLIEALFEIVFDLSGLQYDYTVELSKLHAELSKDYPDIATLPASKLPFGIPDSIVRHRFVSTDKKKLINLGENVMSVNTIEYSVFKDFMKQITSVISKHISVSSERKIRRLGLRYINKLELHDIEEQNILSYDTKYPEFLKGDNTAFEKLYVFQLNGDKMNYRISKNSQPNHTNSLILDMDVFRTFEDKPVDYDMEFIKTWVNEAHEHIKESFVGSLSSTYYELLK
jgi:uncharacterized protein (TIGR04255 family)